MQYDKDLQSNHNQLFLIARNFLLSIDEITETKKERITTYSSHKRGVCHLRTMPHGIDFGFLKGSKMNDSLKRLKGTGKSVRVLSLTEWDVETVQYYIKQAIELNTANRLSS